MHLRAFADEDLNGLLDLWVEAWAATFPQIDFAARRVWFADHLGALSEEGATITVAVADDGSLAGFVTFDEETQLLDQLCVARAHQGSGAAKLLLDSVKRRSPDGIVLAVTQANDRALRFYYREGFEITGEGINPTSRLPFWEMRWRA